MLIYKYMLISLLKREFVNCFDKHTWDQFMNGVESRFGKWSEGDNYKLDINYDPFIVGGEHIEEMINFLLYWVNTPEGWDYWHDKHVKWKKKDFGDTPKLINKIIQKIKYIP